MPSRMMASAAIDPDGCGSASFSSLFSHTVWVRIRHFGCSHGVSPHRSENTKGRTSGGTSTPTTSSVEAAVSGFEIGAWCSMVLGFVSWGRVLTGVRQRK